MTDTLRIHLPPASSEPGEPRFDWALYGGRGELRDTGCGPAAQLPEAGRVELVVGPALTRALRVRVPRVDPARLDALVRYAVEARVAGDVESIALGHGDHEPDGSVRALIASREVLERAAQTLAAAARPPRRAVAEIDLVAPDAEAITCLFAPDGAPVLLTPAAESVPVDTAAGETPPPALLAALRECAAHGARVSRLRVLGSPPPGLDPGAWAGALGLAFSHERGWRWQDAGAQTWSRAVDLLHAAPRQSRSAGTGLRRAAALSLVAGAVWVLASGVEWAYWSTRERALERDLAALAQASSGGVAADPAAAVAAVRAQVRQRRHAAGLGAPDDMLGLLARASPALGQLPPGRLRVLTYEAQQVVIETSPLAPVELGALRGALEAQGIEALAADVQGATRVRLRLDPER